MDQQVLLLNRMDILILIYVIWLILVELDNEIQYFLRFLTHKNKNKIITSLIHCGSFGSIDDERSFNSNIRLTLSFPFE